MKHLGIKAEFVEVDLMAGGLKTPDYAALNPNMKAPTLIDGDLVLWESAAIMAHLCIKTGSDMWPVRNPAEQVEALRWLSLSGALSSVFVRVILVTAPPRPPSLMPVVQLPPSP